MPKIPWCAKRLALCLMTVFLAGGGVPEAVAVSGSLERHVSLGAVNGTINSSQMVEVVRTLPDPVLFQVNRQEVEFAPSRLVVRNAQASGEGRDTLLLRSEEQRLTPQGKSVTVVLQYSVRLWVDGQRVPISWANRGKDVVITVPDKASTVVLRSDDPVTVQMPKGFRGAFGFSVVVSGEESFPVST